MNDSVEVFEDLLLLTAASFFEHGNILIAKEYFLQLYGAGIVLNVDVFKYLREEFSCLHKCTVQHHNQVNTSYNTPDEAFEAFIEMLNKELNTDIVKVYLAD